MKLSGSWRTTLGGVGVLLATVATALTALTDNNPETNVNWEILVAGVSAAFAMIAARDNKVSSEEVGANKETK